nr:unnamed protein product [Callosobruchus chinensis]
MKTTVCFRETNDRCDVYNCGSTLSTGSLSSSFSFRPRGSLARALYHKQKHDEYLCSFDKNEVSFMSFYLVKSCCTAREVFRSMVHFYM